MNKQRRKALENLQNDLDKIKSDLQHAIEIEDGNIPKEKLEEHKGVAADVQSQLETLRDEEQEYYDNMPEGLQAGEKGDKAQEAIDSIDEAINQVETTHDSIGQALEASDKEDKQEYLNAAVDEIENAADSISAAMEG